MARQCAQECLTLYDKKPEPSLHHRVSSEMFGFEDTSLRRFVTEFVSGGPLKANSALLFKVALLKFMPVVERVIEMRHSMIKSMLSSKRQRHPVAISLANRGLEIAKRLDLNPSMLADLGDLLGKVRNGKMVCEMFGFCGHATAGPMISQGLHPTLFLARRLICFFTWSSACNSKTCLSSGRTMIMGRKSGTKL